MSTITLILGASDPEMQAIEELGRQVGAEIRYALSPRGVRVRADEAYETAAITDRLHLDRPALNAPLPPDSMVVAVECAGPAIPTGAIRIDHHQPGDHGYGRPPAEFLPGSSIGQLIGRLGSLGWLPADWPVGDGQYYSAGGCLRLDPEGWAVDDEAGGAPRLIPQRYIHVAAADHCPAAAYRGECPGVDPDALMRWRIESRAAFQRRPPAEILADIARARQVLREAPEIVLARHIVARDMRGQHVPELPEAALREGLCVVADLPPGPDGRVKVVCQAGSPEQIAAFLEQWAPAHGLTDIYGDPARGFAGGYLAARPSEAVRR